MKHAIWMLAVALTVASCTDGQQQKREEMGKKVMEVHDAIMPKMGELVAQEKALLEELQTRAGDTLAVLDSAWTVSVDRTTQELRQAHDDMMDWMSEYRFPTEDIAFDKAMEYMEKEKKRMEEIGNLCTRALHEADSLLSMDPVVEAVENNEE